MESLAKNATTIIILLAFAALGYYLFIQSDSQSIAPGYSSQSHVLAETAVFLERRRTLEQIQFDLRVLENPVFSSLTSYSTPVLEPPIGRDNPFDVIGTTVR
jgi:hypothetical protein